MIRAQLLAGLLPVFLLAPVAAAPPSEPPPFGEVIDVPLVELEVVVTDRDGKAVRDLAAGDFRVFEDDVAVTIDHFERFDEPAARAAAGGEGPGLHLAIFLDEVHVGAASRGRLLAELAAALDERLRPADRVMIAAYDGNVRVLLPFSRDRRALRAALRAAETPSLSRLTVENERRETFELMGADAAGQIGWSPCLHIQEFVDYHAQIEHQRILSAVSAFGAFLDSLAALSGRKAVLHISDGIPLRAGAEAADHALQLCSGVGATQGEPGARDVTRYGSEVFGPEHRRLESSRYDTTPRWEEVTARANAGNISIYTFQAGPSPAAGMQAADSLYTTTGPSTATMRQANLQEPLFRLADQTGARAFLSGADAGRDVVTALAELRSYYLLAYSPRRSAAPGVRRLRVTVERPGAVVRHRKLYAPRTTHERVADQLLARLAHQEESAAAGAGPVLELIDLQPTGDAKVRARFRLRVPLADLARLPGDEPGALERGLFAVFVAASDGRGGSSGVRQSLVPLALPAPGSAVREFLWEVEMLMRPSKQRVGVAVRDEVGGETVYVVREFDLRRG